MVPLSETEFLATGDPPSHIPSTTCGSYPIRAGNLVRPLVDGEAAFRRICAAIEAARHSVWVTVAFIEPHFTMPDRNGSLFDVLDRAVARGLDVRAIFWRPNPEDGQWARSAFPGTPDQRDMLDARRSRFRARWDRAGGAICHHQKSWLLDAGQSFETAFVGGMNLNPRVVVAAGHAEGGVHDVYVEVSGPSATDVHHNFVQRWNEASERGADDGTWGHDGRDDLAFPARRSASKGPVMVQIQRTVPGGRYRDGSPSPGAPPFNIAGGERSILTQYLQAIGAARRSIYIENQAIEVPDIVVALDDALTRGVDVVMLVPAEPEARVRAARARPERRAFYHQLAALGRHGNFALVGLSGPDPAQRRRDVYVHAKIMLVDDAWATIGSCNLHAGSLFVQTEMNASFWDSTVVRALRRELFAEHLDHDTAPLDDRTALGLYRQVAKQNRLRRDAGDVSWQGLAFSLDPTTYGE
jgi:cardiolipin synthase A/B